MFVRQNDKIYLQRKVYPCSSPAQPDPDTVLLHNLCTPQPQSETPAQRISQPHTWHLCNSSVPARLGAGLRHSLCTTQATFDPQQNIYQRRMDLPCIRSCPSRPHTHQRRSPCTSLQPSEPPARKTYPSRMDLPCTRSSPSRRRTHQRRTHCSHHMHPHLRCRHRHILHHNCMLFLRPQRFRLLRLRWCMQYLQPQLPRASALSLLSSGCCSAHWLPSFVRNCCGLRL